MSDENWYETNENPESSFPESEIPETEAVPIEEETPEVQDTVFAADGSYRIVRPEPEDERSYTDANYQPADEATQIPPRYYTPEEPKAKPRRTEEKKRGGFWRAACLALACAVLGGAVGGVIGSKSAKASTPVLQQAQVVESNGSGESASTGVQKATSVSTGTMTASDIYAAACQQVVGITTEVTTQNFFGQTSSAAVSGSGFIITSDGYILTNQHVISYAEQYGYDVSVMTYDGTTYKAEIVGSYANNDIAVLKIDAKDLTPVTFGDSDNMSVGDTVYAVGNPLGELQFSMSTGHVSALDRTITTEESTAAINMFQIDAAVNSGNSGGPCYNTAGQVIGIVSAKASSTGVEGLGFAIPVNDAIAIANELMENGVVVNKVELGVTTQTIPSNVAQYYNMVEGAYIVSVNEGSCAEAAGLQIGDIVTAIDGKTISSSDGLIAALRGYAPGDEAELTIYRAGNTQTITVTLDKVSEETVQAQTQAQQQQQQQQGQQQQDPYGQYQQFDPWSDFFN